MPASFGRSARVNDRPFPKPPIGVGGSPSSAAVDFFPPDNQRRRDFTGQNPFGRLYQFLGHAFQEIILAFVLRHLVKFTRCCENLPCTIVDCHAASLSETSAPARLVRPWLELAKIAAAGCHVAGRRPCRYGAASLFAVSSARVRIPCVRTIASRESDPFRCDLDWLGPPKRCCVKPNPLPKPI